MLDILTTSSKIYIQKQNEPVLFSLSPNTEIGYGTFKRSIDKPYEIKVGISPYSKSFIKRNVIAKDLDFVRAGTTMFHEFAHYEQYKVQDNTEILISDLSKQGNIEYYKHNWTMLPHEIDAEYSGVMSEWDYLENVFPAVADELIENYLKYRTENTKYMIELQENSVISKECIEQLFEMAYDRSLIDRRTIPNNFLRSGDEVAQIFTFEDKTLRREYEPFYRQLQTAGTGQEIDAKMASLVSYLHPNLQDLYSGLDFNKLRPESVFRIPMPESRDEIIARIDPSLTGNILFSSISDEDFTRAVDTISMDDTPQLL